jgi:phage regulator Rha-like protein
MQIIQIIQNRIYTIRGQKVMLDIDLALLYEVETRVLNQSVKRNIAKFPKDLMFRLTANEWDFIRSQFATGSENSNNSSQIVMSSETKILKSKSVASNKNIPSSQLVMMDLPKNRTEKYLPYVFTEHGVTMLASVLKSKRAIDMNIAIVRAFIAIRHFANNHKNLAEQMQELRIELQSRIGEHDVQLASIYDALENLLDKKEDENTQKKKWIERERIGFKK